MLHLAKKLNCPEDQVKNFLSAEYIPLKWQWAFHGIAREADKSDGPVDVGVGGARGPGKAVSLDTLIPTPNGFTTMGDIKVGDFIYAPDGTETKVLGKSKIQNDRTCYDVVFSDGSIVTADEEHLWHTFTKQERVATNRRDDSFRSKRRQKRSSVHKPILVGLNTKEKPKGGIRTTKEIKQTLYHSSKEINHSIDVTEAIKGEEKPLPIHPYLLGVWLGDGSSDCNYITCFDEQIIDEIKDFGYDVYKLKGDGLYGITGMTPILKSMGLIKNKHIPISYLRASKEQRIALLQGLNDTDGYCDKDGSVEFTNTNKKLAEQYYELVCSLGIKATSKESNATVNGKITGRKWRIRYTTEIKAFLLKRKSEVQNIKCTKIIKRRFIVEVRERASVPVQCITVDHSSHCFLIGKSFIPTHNSHCVFAQLTLDDCQRVPYLKGLFLRKTGKSASESFDDLINSVLVGRVRHQYNPSKNILKFPNGSKIILGGFEAERDIDKYVGIQYDVIAIEERNQLSGDKILKLKGSLRTTKPNWRTRTYSSFNPGNIGHNEVKETFIIPYQKEEEKRTRFIPATYKDNPYLKDEYVDYLENLPGSLGKAWREGNFDIFEGQYFREWNRDQHVVVPFEIPKSFKRFRAYDHGTANPACCKWYALDYDGRLYVYKELYVTGWNVDQIADEINRMSEGETYEYSVADSAIFANMGMVDRGGGETIAQNFARHGVVFIPSSKRRVDGWTLMRQYLHWTPTQPAKLKYFSTCKDSIRTIPSLIHDEKKPEDINSQSEDHAADTDRYLISSLHEQRTIPPKTGVAKLLENRNRIENDLIRLYSGEEYRKTFNTN